MVRSRPAASEGSEARPIVLEDEVVLIKTEKPLKAELAPPMRTTRSRSAALLHTTGSELWPIRLDSDVKTERPIKSESVMRAEAAEARVAALEAALAATPPSKKRRFEWDSESDLLKQRLAEKEKELAAKERQLKAMRNFRKIRSEMKSNIEKVQKEMNLRYARANTLDLVIVMDCTGSLSPWIQAATTSIISIIDNVKAEHANAAVQVGFVAYRDFCDRINRLQVQLLTSDVAQVRDFIGTLRAHGGGDGPEDIPGGLQEVLAMGMQAEAKCVVLFADAPCHGSEFHSPNTNMTDGVGFGAQIDASPSIREQMRQFARNGVDFAFVDIVPSATAKMVRILEAEYKSVRHENEAIFERDFVTVPLADFGGVVRFESVVQTLVSKSLTASKSRASSHHRPTNRLKLATPGIAEEDEEESDDDASSSATMEAASMALLDWEKLERLPEIGAVRHSYHFRSGDDIDWAKLDLKHSTQQTKIKIQPTCFAKGAMRAAHGMYDCKMGKRFVAKCYFGKTAKSEFSVESDVEMQIVAKRLATNFSLLPQVEDAVDFIFTCWYELKDPTAAGLNASMAKFTAEPYIEGEYKKYNNNNGWINEANLAMGEVAQAFSHFTWQVTFGHLMVVDIQGVGGIFTDPQIHSLQEVKFGRGNLSKAGMTAFLCTHKCNAVCSALKLASFNEGKMRSGKRKATTKRKKTTTVDKITTCSCPLCGTIMTLLYSKFVEAHAQEREVYCDDCNTKVNKHELGVCAMCNEDMVFSQYWYDMKGMEYPKTCEQCKAVATEAITPCSSTKG